MLIARAVATGRSPGRLCLALVAAVDGFTLTVGVTELGRILGWLVVGQLDTFAVADCVELLIGCLLLGC